MMPAGRSDATWQFVRLALLWFVLASMAALAWVYSELIVWRVIAPLIADVVIISVFLLYLRRVDRAVPYFEIGAYCGAITFLYCAYPMILYALHGYTYPELADGRLYMLRNRADDLGALAWWYVLYLLCFCIAYVAARGREPLRLPLKISRPDGAVISAIVILVVSVRLFFIVVGVFYDMSASSYFDEYLVYSRLPLLLRQVTVHLKMIELTLQMMLVVALCCAPRKRYRIMLAAVLMITCIAHLLWPGARVGLFAVILAAVAAYDLTVRRIAFRWVILGAAIGFVVLAVMGTARHARGVPGRGLSRIVIEQTEFEVIFANAADLKYMKELSGGFLDKPNLYWAGFLALVPQQFLSISKDTTAGWYVREFYPEYAQMGGGLAFGVLSEAVMGHGLIELVWRAALVGVALGFLHRRLMRREVSFTFLMFYIWLMVWSYQTIRSGTFAPLILILYQFVAPLLGIIILSAVLRRGRRVARRLIPSAPVTA
jgi:hypothetical protein